MEQIISTIEDQIAHDPELFWIVRKRSQSMKEGPGLYFAHICNGTNTVSAKGYADTPKQALQNAFEGYVEGYVLDFT